MYIPYVILSNMEKPKIESILAYDIPIYGLIFDYRWLGSKYNRKIRTVIHKVLDKNSSALIIFDPLTIAFQVEQQIRIQKRSLEEIYRLAGYDTSIVADDSYFTHDTIKQRLYIINDNLKRNIHSCMSSLSMIIPRRINYYFIPAYFVAREYGDEWYHLTLESISYALKEFENEHTCLGSY